MSDRDGKRVAIFGKSGSGKTELANAMTMSEQRLFVFDPKGSWLKKPGFEVIKHFSQVIPFLRSMKGKPFRVVYSPEVLRAPERLSTLSLMLLDFQRGYFFETSNDKITLLVDELSDGFPLNLPRGAVGFAEACQKGREFGLNVVGITQRPATVHGAFRGNLDVICCFEFSFVNDRKAVALAMQDQQIETALMGLGKYEYICFENGQWEKKRPVKLANT